MIHGLLSACADMAFYSYSKNFYGHKIANQAFILRLISWFTIYTCTRSLTNNLEEIFTIFCLNCLHNPKSTTIKMNNSYWLFHFVCFISFIVRSTAAINLIPIYVYQFFYLIKSNSIRLKFIIQFIVTG